MYRISVIGALTFGCLMLGFLTSCGKNGSDTSVSAAGTERSSAEALLEEVKKVVAGKDIEMLVALGHWEGVPDKYPNVIRTYMTDIFDYTDPTFSISEMTPQEKADSNIGGKTYTWNIQPYGWITIASEKRGSKIPIGTEDGKFYLATKLEK